MLSLKRFNIYSVRIIIIHMVIGSALFYFLVHPFTMVINRLELSNAKFNGALLITTLKGHLLESFTLNMLNMSLSYIIFGAILGLGFGFAWLIVQRKNQLIYNQSQLLKEDILQLIELGESDRLEFKSSMRFDYQLNTINKSLDRNIAKAIVGFMNAKGGKLMIGVADNGQILGLNNDYLSLKNKNRDGFEQKLYQLVIKYIDKASCFNIKIYFYKFDNKDIAVITIKQSSEPVFLKENNSTKFYVRNGNATIPLSIKETLKYLENRS